VGIRKIQQNRDFSGFTPEKMQFSRGFDSRMIANRAADLFVLFSVTDGLQVYPIL